MTALRTLAALARADFLERVRRPSFLVTLGFTLWAAYMFLPPNHAKYATLNLSGHRGIYNSAWVGTVVALLAVSFLSLAGFYLVKNAVERDRRTGVGQIVAATPVATPLYLVGKLLSNFAVLGSMVAALVVAAGAMQLVHGEDTHLDLAALVSPFLVVTLPTMALVAAVAVCFEVVPWLRGGGGNVVYFILWIATLSLSSVRGHVNPGHPIGIAAVIPQMQEACAAAYPEYPGAGGPFTMGFNIREAGVWDLKLFTWEGARWTPAMLASRLGWVAVAGVLPLLMALIFDRFDTAAAAPRPRRARRARAAAVAEAATPGWTVTRPLERLTERAERSRFGGLVLAELRIMLKGVTRWWTLVALGLVALGLFVPLTGVRGFVAPFAMIWPLLFWSPMGTRELRYRTDALLFSTPRPVVRLLAAQWLAGVAVAGAVAAGCLAHLVVIAEWSSVAALAAGVVFVPSLALALGTWTGSAKTFEVLYLLLWYAGPMNRIAVIDFVGSTQPGAGPAAPLTFAAAAAVLLALAVLGRRRQVRG